MVSMAHNVDNAHKSKCLIRCITITHLMEEIAIVLTARNMGFPSTDKDLPQNSHKNSLTRLLPVATESKIN